MNRDGNRTLWWCIPTCLLVGFVLCVAVDCCFVDPMEARQIEAAVEANDAKWAAESARFDNREREINALNEADPAGEAELPDDDTAVSLELATRLIGLIEGKEARLALLDGFESELFDPDVADYSEEFRSAFKIEAEATVDELVREMAKAYTYHLSTKELQEVVQFYESETGKTWAEVGEDISEDTYEAGRDWGARCFSRIEEKLGIETE